MKKSYQTICINASEKPKHVNESMFIKGETYIVKVAEYLIGKRVEEKRREWVSSAGAMACLIDDMSERDYNEIINGFRKEAIKEETFVSVEGRFGNRLGGSEYKQRLVKKVECKKHLKYISE